MPRLACLLLALVPVAALAACAPFPAVEMEGGPQNATPPPLLPIDELLQQAGPDSADPGPAVAARAAALKARAAALQTDAASVAPSPASS